MAKIDIKFLLRNRGGVCKTFFANNHYFHLKKECVVKPTHSILLIKWVKYFHVTHIYCFKLLCGNLFLYNFFGNGFVGRILT